MMERNKRRVAERPRGPCRDGIPWWDGLASACLRWHIASVKVAAALVVLVTAACSGDASNGSVEGPKIFATMCSTCHGPTGKPPEAMAVRGVRDLTSKELRARVTPALVEHQVRTGSENKLMPSFVGVLNDDQIKAIAAYVASPQFMTAAAAAQ